VPELDVRHLRITQGEGCRQKFPGKNLLRQSVWKTIEVLRQHDAAARAGKHLPNGIHIGVGFPVCSAEVLFVDQVSVAENQQAAMLARGLRILERGIKPALVDAGGGTNFGSLVQRTPAAICVRRREVGIIFSLSASRQVQKRNSHWKGKQCSSGQAHGASAEQNMVRAGFVPPAILKKD
jgi:hypothetical protein